MWSLVTLMDPGTLAPWHAWMPGTMKKTSNVHYPVSRLVYIRLFTYLPTHQPNQPLFSTHNMKIKKVACGLNGRMGGQRLGGKWEKKNEREKGGKQRKGAIVHIATFWCRVKTGLDRLQAVPVSRNK